MSNFVYFISSDKIGSQDSELGTRLMNTFFLRLIQADSLPSHILLLERGVKLLLPESPCLDAVKALEGRGVEVLASRACLDYYGMREKAGAGKVVGLRDMIEVMQDSGNVIHL